MTQKILQKRKEKRKQKNTPHVAFVESASAEAAHIIDELCGALDALNIPHAVIAEHADASDTDIVVFIEDRPAYIREVMQELCVPVAPQNQNGRKDYNPLQEEGNGFYFKNPSKWEIFAAIVRACETYQFPYDWENLLRALAKGAK